MSEFKNSIRLLSEYIIGTQLPNDDFSDLEILKHWLKFKEDRLEKSNYSLERTQNITFFHIIELPTFENKLKELALTYHKSNPYGGKDDFINDTFGYTIAILTKFIGINNIYMIPYSTPPYIQNDIYSCDEFHKSRIIDIVVGPGKDIKWYKQYYKKIIEIIYCIDFDGIIAKANLSIINPDAEDNTPNISLLPVTNINNDSNSFAEKYLFFLDGKSHTNNKYLNHEDYIRLIEYTNYFFSNLELPPNIKPVNSLYFKAGELRYAFYLMFKEKYPGSKYPESLFNFLSKVFPILKDVKKREFRNTSNYKKFNHKPQYWEDLMNKNK